MAMAGRRMRKADRDLPPLAALEARRHALERMVEHCEQLQAKVLSNQLPTDQLLKMSQMYNAGVEDVAANFPLQRPERGLDGAKEKHLLLQSAPLHVSSSPALLPAVGTLRPSQLPPQALQQDVPASQLDCSSSSEAAPSHSVPAATLAIPTVVLSAAASPTSLEEPQQQPQPQDAEPQDSTRAVPPLQQQQQQQQQPEAAPPTPTEVMVQSQSAKEVAQPVETEIAPDDLQKEVERLRAALASMQELEQRRRISNAGDLDKEKEKTAQLLEQVQELQQQLERSSKQMQGELNSAREQLSAYESLGSAAALASIKAEAAELGSLKQLQSLANMELEELRWQVKEKERQRQEEVKHKEREVEALRQLLAAPLEDEKDQTTPEPSVDEASAAPREAAVVPAEESPKAKATAAELHRLKQFKGMVQIELDELRWQVKEKERQRQEEVEHRDNEIKALREMLAKPQVGAELEALRRELQENKLKSQAELERKERDVQALLQEKERQWEEQLERKQRALQAASSEVSQLKQFQTVANVELDELRVQVQEKERQRLAETERREREVEALRQLLLQAAEEEQSNKEEEAQAPAAVESAPAPASETSPEASSRDKADTSELRRLRQFKGMVSIELDELRREVKEKERQRQEEVEHRDREIKALRDMLSQPQPAEVTTELDELRAALQEKEHLREEAMQSKEREIQEKDRQREAELDKRDKDLKEKQQQWEEQLERKKRALQVASTELSQLKQLQTVATVELDELRVQVQEKERQRQAESERREREVEALRQLLLQAEEDEQASKEDEAAPADAESASAPQEQAAAAPAAEGAAQEASPKEKADSTELRKLRQFKNVVNIELDELRREVKEKERQRQEEVEHRDHEIKALRDMLSQPQAAVVDPEVDELRAELKEKERQRQEMVQSREREIQVAASELQQMKQLHSVANLELEELRWQMQEKERHRQEEAERREREIQALRHLLIQTPESEKTSKEETGTAPSAGLETSSTARQGTASSLEDSPKVKADAAELRRLKQFKNMVNIELDELRWQLQEKERQRQEEVQHRDSEIQALRQMLSHPASVEARSEPPAPELVPEATSAPEEATSAPEEATSAPKEQPVSKETLPAATTAPSEAPEEADAAELGRLRQLQSKVQIELDELKQQVQAKERQRQDEVERKNEEIKALQALVNGLQDSEAAAHEQPNATLQSADAQPSEPAEAEEAQTNLHGAASELEKLINAKRVVDLELAELRWQIQDKERHYLEEIAQKDGQLQALRQEMMVETLEAPDRPTRMEWDGLRAITSVQSGSTVDRIPSASPSEFPNSPVAQSVALAEADAKIKADAVEIKKLKHYKSVATVELEGLRWQVQEKERQRLEEAEHKDRELQALREMLTPQQAAEDAAVKESRAKLAKYEELGDIPTLLKWKHASAELKKHKQFRNQMNVELDELRFQVEEKDREKEEVLARERKLAVKYKQLDIFKLDNIARTLKALDGDLGAIGKQVSLLQNHSGKIVGINEQKAFTTHGEQMLQQTFLLRSKVRDLLTSCLTDAQRIAQVTEVGAKRHTDHPYGYPVPAQGTAT